MKKQATSGERGQCFCSGFLNEGFEVGHLVLNTHKANELTFSCPWIFFPAAGERVGYRATLD